jgi:hypothetical protein
MATLLESVIRAERRVHGDVARGFPRKIQRFIEEAKDLIRFDPEIAEECTYILPGFRDSKEIDPKTGKPKREPITGPSVRLAEIAFCCWGNIDFTLRILDDDGQWITAQASGHDSEKNNHATIEMKERVIDKFGRRYSVGVIKSAMQAGQSKAKRNMMFELIPRALIYHLWEYSKEVARGDPAKLGERTEKAVAKWATKGVSAAQIWAALGIDGAHEMTLDKLQNLISMWVSVKDGDATVDDLFPRETAPEAGNWQRDVEARIQAAQAPQAVHETPKRPEAVATPPVATPTEPVAAPAADAQAAQTPVTKTPDPAAKPDTARRGRHVGPRDEPLLGPDEPGSRG